ncbi:MAG: NUDIX hydrolase [Candidatus Omnitrophica bacterium]|nr:NUDIX hydrolase [Candidatus Omnitrophota bacterium]
MKDRTLRKPKIAGKRVRYKSPWIHLIEKSVLYPGESKSRKYVSVKAREYCTVLAVTPKNKVVLVRQYRPIVENFTLELPSGCIDGKESPMAAAVRELTEETGFRPTGRMEFLGALYPDSGRLENRMWSYFARSVVPARGASHREKGVETVLCTWTEVKEMIREGRILHGPHLGVIALALLSGRLRL